MLLTVRVATVCMTTGAAGELISAAKQKMLRIALPAACLAARLLGGDRFDQLVFVLDDLLQISVMIRDDLVQLLYRIDGVLLGVDKILSAVTTDQPIAMPVQMVHLVMVLLRRRRWCSG